MSGVVRLGLVVRIALDPGGATRGRIGDHAIEQRGRHPVPPIGWSDHETGHADHLTRRGAIAVDQLEQAVLGAQRSIDPAHGAACDVSEIAVRGVAAQPIGDGRSRFAPSALGLLGRSGHMRLEAIAGGPVGVAGESVTIEETEPVLDAVRRHRVNRDGSDLRQALGLVADPLAGLAIVPGVVAQGRFRVRPGVLLLAVMEEEVFEGKGVCGLQGLVALKTFHVHGFLLPSLRRPALHDGFVPEQLRLVRKQRVGEPIHATQDATLTCIQATSRHVDILCFYLEPARPA